MKEFVLNHDKMKCQTILNKPEKKIITVTLYSKWHEQNICHRLWIGHLSVKDVQSDYKKRMTDLSIDFVMRKHYFIHSPKFLFAIQI